MEKKTLRKKTHDKRLEFDFKQRKNPPPPDLKIAEEKFYDYKNRAYTAMSDFLNNDFEKMDNLIDLTRGILKRIKRIIKRSWLVLFSNYKELANYHLESSKILEETISHLNEKYLKFTLKISYISNFFSIKKEKKTST